MGGDDTAFYGAVAGLIPVLVLAGVVILERFNAADADPEHGTRRGTWLTLWLVASLLVSAASGEALALGALLDGARPNTAASVTVSLLLLFMILALGALRPVLYNLERHGVPGALWKGSRAIIALAGLGMTALGIQVLARTF